jgi:1-acyl-sn-glycerol-3-phosphate acyltransferase
VRRYCLAHAFHAVRFSWNGRPRYLPDVPLIVVLNHPSWWDPLVCVVVSELFPERAHFAAMDAEALRRYRVFNRLGFFGVEMGTMRGAQEFLRTSREILARPQTALWITPQGRFVDARERPPGIRPGVAHLVSSLEKAVILPLALEYVFWEHRRPEALARFGEAIIVKRGSDLLVDDWRLSIEAALARTQEELKTEAQKRDPAAFQVLVGAKARFGGTYRHLWSLPICLLGRDFRAGGAK